MAIEHGLEVITSELEMNSQQSWLEINSAAAQTVGPNTSPLLKVSFEGCN